VKCREASSLSDLAFTRPAHREVIQVRPGQIVPALDVAERGVASKAEQAAHALTACLLLSLTAVMVMVDANPLTILEWLIAHGAGVSLAIQEPIESFPGETVPGETLCAIPALDRFGRIRAHPLAAAYAVILHGLGR
jgi:hypothetical protein